MVALSLPARPRTVTRPRWVGMRDAAHATAFGKCVLSCLDKPGRDDYLSRHELADLTPRTVTDRRVLERTLGARPAYVVVQGRDPVPTYEAALRARGVLDDDGVKHAQETARERVEDAIAFAARSAEPDPASALDHVFA